MRLQLNTRASVRRNEEFGTNMLMFSFHLGPLEIFCLAHVPKNGEAYTRTYIKVQLRSRSLLEDGKKVEAWDVDGEEARSPTGHAKKSGSGEATQTDLLLGPMALSVTADGEVKARLCPRKTTEHESKVIESWLAVK